MKRCAVMGSKIHMPLYQKPPLESGFATFCPSGASISPWEPLYVLVAVTAIIKVFGACAVQFETASASEDGQNQPFSLGKAVPH